ncbi:hypothetical protein GGX14DRAFT_560553 [Mycena pura]|uniref:Uncharacterized protein n=1 Tax=Mycena pura TaxID=153505 RepID=A0AAD6VQ38_9AGAR|nr:hypothetical protein GGX14DRAFT_560553 [Mycena pura]
MRTLKMRRTLHSASFALLSTVDTGSIDNDSTSTPADAPRNKHVEPGCDHGCAALAPPSSEVDVGLAWGNVGLAWGVVRWSGRPLVRLREAAPCAAFTLPLYCPTRFLTRRLRIDPWHPTAPPRRTAACFIAACQRACAGFGHRGGRAAPLAHTSSGYVAGPDVDLAVDARSTEPYLKSIIRSSTFVRVAILNTSTPPLLAAFLKADAEDTDIDVGDSPCPSAPKCVKKVARALVRAETLECHTEVFDHTYAMHRKSAMLEMSL